jgi:hypothetical protein
MLGISRYVIIRPCLFSIAFEQCVKYYSFLMGLIKSNHFDEMFPDSPFAHRIQPDNLT